MAGDRLQTQVLVVGSGPAGLLLAVELRRREVDCLLIDLLDAPQPWDRATVVHPRSMEIFEALGLAERMLERGVRTRAARFRSGGEVLGKLDLTTTGSRYDFDLGISEEVTESVLTDHLEGLGGEVVRSTRLISLEQGGDEVVATLEHAGERSEVRADWVVGCDGLHSVVRGEAGIDFPGAAISAQWAVFDASIDGWDEEYDVAAAFLETPAVILTPLPGRRWRVYLRPTSEGGDLVADAERTVHAYKPAISFTEIENPARFHCHSRVAAAFRSGRLLLAGDAAHVCSPAEGHGMNTGLQDAFNLGWKLAMVCRGEASPSLLDSYELERRPVALRVAESGSDAEGGQAITAAAERAERDAAIKSIYADPESAHHESVGAAELDRSYADSPIVAGDPKEALGPGVLLPDTAPIEIAGRSSAESLHELAGGPGHTLIVLGGPSADLAEVDDLAARLAEAHAEEPAVDAVLCLPELDGTVASQLGIAGVTVLAIRPDRYVGLRHDGGDPAAVSAYLEALSVG